MIRLSGHGSSNDDISNVTCEIEADAIMFLHLVHEAPRQSGVYHFASPDSIHTAAYLPMMHFLSTHFAHRLEPRSRTLRYSVSDPVSDLELGTTL
jgi:hypothetical protein